MRYRPEPDGDRAVLHRGGWHTRRVAEIGIRVVIRDASTLDERGTCTVPAPVEPGDLIATEHGTPLRVVAVLPVRPDARETPVLACPASLTVVAR